MAKDSYGVSLVLAKIASEGSSTNRLTISGGQRRGLTFGLSAHRSYVDAGGVYEDANNQGKPYILGLNAEALRPKKGKKK